MLSFLQRLLGNNNAKEIKKMRAIADHINEIEPNYVKLSDANLVAKTDEFKRRLQKGETLDDILPEAFAVVREASKRVLGMRHFDVQLIGGICLHRGNIAEMRTGEGKTLVATLPVYLNALTGNGVHVVTVNDYLATRDSEQMGRLYNFLGLSTGLIVANLDFNQRKEAYACDITYGTNNEFGFDYLRDNMVSDVSQMVQRPLNYAIVDEVDSILIDEARTPLIISGPGQRSTDNYYKLAKIVPHLVKDEDYTIDEKQKTIAPTDSGIAKVEKMLGVENLYDSENIELNHLLGASLRAYAMMHRDTDYVVKDGEVVIVDEFTGRLMFGRRYSDGLHQAIEAKEGLKVERESQTLASVTFQNYFRLYNKLSGMTGTAMTEEDEFREIYKLDVIAIPTNRPIKRIDRNDLVYRTEAAKYRAIIEQIIECHEKGQPVLVGTISIEKSELLSAMLKKKGIKHEVLNAKYHAKEAEIVAQAGKLGAVTIATNMAGRGTDIMLGGNAEFLARAEMRKKAYPEEIITEAIGYADTDNEEVLAAREEYQELYRKFSEEVKEKAVAVKEAGGLYILGTERHESRRIDNQLRGRSGRQGDEGESRFFLSVEDDLMRVFAGDRLENLMRTLNVDENTPIESKSLSKIIESSQKKVEGRNFSIRKNVLNYDDVMNTQREIIYKERQQVLDGEDLHDSILKMMEELISDTVKQYINEEVVDRTQWNLVGLKDHFLGWITEENDLEYEGEDLEKLTVDTLIESPTEKAKSLYAAREEQYGSDVIRELERVVMLKVVDTKWMAHIDDMSELKKGIGLRAYGQQNPVVEYQYEGFEMFDAMVASIKEDTIRMLLTMQLRQNQAPEREQVSKPDAPNAGAGDGSFGTQRRNPARAAKKNQK